MRNPQNRVDQAHELGVVSLVLAGLACWAGPSAAWLEAMPARRRSNQPAQSLAPILLLAVVGIAATSAWFGLPPVGVAWAGVLAVAWLEPPAILTGKKDDWGYPSPANPTEEARMRRFKQWRQLRVSLIPIPGLATGLAPGWPPLASWLAGVWAAGVAYLLPCVGNRYLTARAGHLLDAAAAFVLVVEVTAARRAVAGSDHPGTRLDSLPGAVARSIGAMTARAMAGAVSGLIVGIILATLAHRYGASFGWGGLVAELHLDRHLVHPGLELSSPTALDGLLALGGAFAAIARPWQRAATETWSELVDTKAAWAPRWAGLKLDAPSLIGHTTMGTATIDTFEAPAHLGSAAFLPLGPKLAPALGAGMAVAVLERPDEIGGLPAAGTRHPRRFDVVTWPSASLPDPRTEDDPALVQLFAHAAMVWTLEPLGYGRPVPTGIELVSDPGSPKRIWASTWGWPGGPGLQTIRQAGAPGGGPLVSVFPSSFGCPVLIDHRAGEAGVVYFGAIGDPETVLAPEHEHLAARFAELAEEDRWVTIWDAVLKRGSVHPTIQHGVTAERSLGNEVSLHRVAFATPWGIDPTELLGLEGKLATALGAAPFVSITGWTQKGSGERHPQAFAVHWSERAVPTSPDRVPPSDAASWVLAGQVNAAFDDLRLARPEVVEAVPLTITHSKAHIWQITLKLYGGVTAADVRERSERLRRALGAPWLRVEDARGGVTLYVGAEPSAVELKDRRSDALRLSALDWDQAWQDAGVLGSNGDVPHLADLGRLPHNRIVEVRDFLLPPGVDRARVKAALGKLKATTSNAFVEARESPKGPSHVRLLVAPESPLPQMVPFDFAAADEVAAKVGGIAFATGVEGEPVVFDPLESPHLLAAGVTGAGKSSLIEALCYGAAIAGAELYVVDPVKGAADFAFLRDYTRAFATTPLEAAAVMKAVYEEVKRRKELNAAHGIGSVLELPEHLRPRRIFVVVDEFTSLIGADPVPKQPFDDPDEEAERQLQLAVNAAKQQVGIYAGRFAREARSAGLTLLLGTQKLMARTLDTLPSSSDLKTNLARILLGKASTGERMSALRAFDDAPVLEGDIPKGRGLYEPLTSSALVIQAWYATQEQYRSELERRVAKLAPDARLDLSPYLARSDDPLAKGRAAPARPSTDEGVVVDLGEIEFSLDDIEEDDQASQAAACDPSAKASSGSAGSTTMSWAGFEFVEAKLVERPNVATGAATSTVASGHRASDTDAAAADSTGPVSAELANAEPAGAHNDADEPEATDERWQIDWDAPAQSSSAPAHDKPEQPPTVPDDEWGIAPRIQRRSDNAESGAGGKARSSSARPPLDDAF